MRDARAAVPANAGAVRRELLRLLDLALERATTRDRLAPIDVHEIRKLIKRARAQLAVLRPVVGAPDYEQANRCLREAAKCLATARDSAVMAQLRRDLMEDATDGQQASTRQAPRVSTDADPKPASRRLRVARARVTAMTVRGRAWGSLGPGIRAVYRRGRRCAKAAKAAPASETLHEWRKQVKRLWHVLEPFVPANPARLGAKVRDARRLSDMLGEEHDLAMLEAMLQGPRARRSPVDNLVLARAAARRASLTRRALEIGARLYSEPPRSFEHRLRQDFDSWRKRSPGRT